MPPVIYVAVWTMRDGKRMPTLTSLATYTDWNKDPEGYSQKRIERYNRRNLVPIRPNRRPHFAISFVVERYIPANSFGNAKFAEAGSAISV